MTIHDLPTPALLLDRDVFEANVRHMASHVAAAGKKFRPHAKAHKCVEIAKRQIAAGAAGICVATIAEAEVMAAAAIPGILLTSPLADPAKIARAVALPDVTVVVDHPEQVRMYGEAAVRASVRVSVLLDLDVGDHRTGIAPGTQALELATLIEKTSGLHLRGLQAYSVRASHMNGQEGRGEFSDAALACAAATRDLLRKRGVDTEILTGGSTGTYLSDAAAPFLTELQAGSYALMDVAYAGIGGVNFGQALTVLATVVSANHPDRVTVDAGFKAFSTDRPFGPQAKDLTGGRYEWAGDEFGFVHLDEPSRPVRLGDRLRFVPPHCDPTVNLYDRIHVCRGEEVEEVWPVMNRVSWYTEHHAR